MDGPNKTPTPQQQPRRGLGLGFFYILLLVWFMIFARDFLDYKKNVEPVPYSQFLSYVDKNQVGNVVVGKQRIEGTLKQAPPGHPKDFVTTRMDDPLLTQRLTRANVRFEAIQESGFFRDLMSWVIPALILVGFWWLLMNRSGQAGNQFLSFGKSKARVYVEKDVPTRFTDVAGIDEAKSELEEVVRFLRSPHQYSRLGGRMPKGILLVGPPGTGKTLLARAVAGEASVPYFSINGSEFVELFVGLGAARVRDLFAQARAHAPCIIFIDELDALGRARGLSAITGSANDEKEQTLNQLLAELDGFDPSIGVVLLAATNRPEVLDPALLRSGRFDRQILIGKPDRKGRTQILSVHMKKIHASDNLSPETLSSLTAGFSGADLANLVNEAALIATRRQAEKVELRDFTEGIERIIAGLERKSTLLSPQEKKRVAYHEMGHAVIALAKGQDEVVHKVSIIPRGIGALGYTFKRPTEDRYLMSQSELENKIAMLLGGRISEVIFFKDVSTGAADDLDKATEIARAMVTRYGMSERLGYVTFEKEPATLLGGQAPMKSMDYSPEIAHEIDLEVRGIIERGLKAAEECIRRYILVVEEGARTLMSQETIDEAQLKAIWERYQEKKQPTLQAVS